MLINRNNYIIKEIPHFNPFSIDRINFWKEQKYKSIYGAWSGGMWIPGPLYHYINFWHIEIKENEDSKNPVLGRPFFRDVEYDFYMAYTEARGFSRFEFQTLEEVAGKTPREIMQASYSKDMGRPLFENPAKNMVMVTARGCGKSYLLSNLIGCEFLHAPKSSISKGKGKKDIVVGASLAAYSDHLLDKVRVGLENLPGAEDYKGDYYPSPFYKKYSGTWKSGDAIKARYKVRKGMNEIEKGDGSMIKHVTYNTKAFGGLGTRPVLCIKEEAGEFPNLITAWNADMQSLVYDGQQFGTQIAIGTGGNMKSGTVDLKKIFMDPAGFNCVAFEDTYDNSNKKICLFYDTTMGMNKFKDENGNTKRKEALEFVIAKRKNLYDIGASKQVIEQDLQFQPLRPSEAFLISGGNIFPKDDLLKQLQRVETSDEIKNMGSVGRIEYNEAGNLEFVLDPKKSEITKFPLDVSNDAEGAIVIWEHPIKDAPYGLYICGCLTPGEKVMTSSGLKNVENVTINDLLYNENGKEVHIKELLRYNVKNEDVYKLQISNTYRTTSFTKEHPILVSDPFVKCDLTIDENRFSFSYRKADELKKDQWIKVPNIYKRDNQFDINTLWDNAPYRIDRTIKSPLENPDFWWLVGLWLGDGWCEYDGYKITISFNINEKLYLDRFKDIVNNLLGRLVSIDIKIDSNCLEASFSHQQLSLFLSENFGKYAHGKYIPEWAKMINNECKSQLILGYLDSDGCVSKHTKGYYTTEFVSINLELLESVQDILFSIGIISNMSKMRNGRTDTIDGKICNIKPCYHLRLGNYDTILLAKSINRGQSIKLNKVDLENLMKTRRRAKDGCFFDESKDYIYFKIREITKSTYSGIVYNFECDTHTFMCHHITTHNCDPYDHDKSQSGSLGSTIIYKRFLDAESTYEFPVAEYTGRPETADMYYESVRKLLLYYNARLLFENERKGIHQYFSFKDCTYLLIDQPMILEDIIKNSTVDRKKGCHMTTQIKEYAEEKLKIWLLTEYAPGHKNVEKIYSQGLLRELIDYNDDGNFDRVIAMMMVMIFRDEVHKRFVKKKDDYEDLKKFFNIDAYKNKPIFY